MNAAYSIILSGSCMALAFREVDPGVRNIGFHLVYYRHSGTQVVHQRCILPWVPILALPLSVLAGRTPNLFNHV